MGHLEQPDCDEPVSNSPQIPWLTGGSGRQIAQCLRTQGRTHACHCVLNVTAWPANGQIGNFYSTGGNSVDASGQCWLPRAPTILSVAWFLISIRSTGQARSNPSLRQNTLFLFLVPGSLGRTKRLRPHFLPPN